MTRKQCEGDVLSLSIDEVIVCMCVCVHIVDMESVECKVKRGVKGEM